MATLTCVGHLTLVGDSDAERDLSVCGRQKRRTGRHAAAERSGLMRRVWKKQKLQFLT